MAANTPAPDYTQERQILVRQKVPSDVVDYVLGQAPSRAYRTGERLLRASLGGVGLIALFFAFSKGVDIKDGLMRAAAADAHALLFAGAFGVSALLAMCAWLIVSSLLARYAATRTARGRASIFVFAIAEDFLSPRLSGNWKREADAEPSAYVDRLLVAQAIRRCWFAAALVACAPYIYAREMQTWTIFTSDAAVARPFFPWDGVRTFRWSEATAVQTDCHHHEGNQYGASYDSVVYEVVHPERIVSLSDAKPLNGLWLDQVETIDARLSARGVERRRKSSGLNATCLRAEEEAFGANWPRVMRLLRVDAP